MRVNFMLAGALLIVLSGQAFGQTPKVVCEVNRATGKLQATTAWRNVLGEAADKACLNAMPSAPARSPTATLSSYAANDPNTLQAMQRPVAEAARMSGPIQMPGLMAPPKVVSEDQLIKQAEFPASAGPRMNVGKPVFAPASAASKPMIIEKHWLVELKDITLAATFTRWAEGAGYRVRWDADKNVLVDAPDDILGTFEDAVTAVLTSPGITQGTYPLEVCFYANTPPLARVTRKGEQKDCK